VRKRLNRLFLGSLLAIAAGGCGSSAPCEPRLTAVERRLEEVERERGAAAERHARELEDRDSRIAALEALGSQTLAPEADPDVDPRKTRGRAPEPAVDGRRLPIVRVFYATDRKATGFTVSTNFYGSARGSGLTYGICTVSIPPGHERGVLETESWTRLEFVPDVNEHVVLLRVSPFDRNDFYTRLRSSVSSSPRKSAIVFIHGYNTTFSVAARRTAQLVYDIGFDGVPILYSWPSYGGLFNYSGDEGNAEWTVPHLQKFLAEVAAESGAESVHVIAHSMGNRALIRALEKLDATRRPQPLFQELVFTAPDVDADIFSRLADTFVRLARRVTLYASANDKALLASRVAHSDQPRAGEAGENLLVVPGVDTVDVSGLDTSFFATGHSYVSANSLAMTDLRKLIIERKEPARRGLQRLIQASRVFWRHATGQTEN
jgi:esterase/lipase superfamily enzyme